MISILKDIRSGALPAIEIPGFFIWLACNFMDPFWFHNPWDLPPRFHSQAIFSVPMTADIARNGDTAPSTKAANAAAVPGEVKEK